MNSNIIFETLNKLKVKDEESKKQPMYIYKDEKTGQIIEKPLQDMAASALIHKIVNPAKLIHDSVFAR